MSIFAFQKGGLTGGLVCFYAHFAAANNKLF
jgi:hypothetical protein